MAEKENPTKEAYWNWRDLKGCVVTTDALNCRTTVARKAVEKKADYVLAVKGNHPVMHDEVKRHMDACLDPAPESRFF